MVNDEWGSVRRQLMMMMTMMVMMILDVDSRAEREKAGQRLWE
jgi:hypothetical protein